MLTDIDLSFTVQPDDELIVTDIEEGIERFESLTDERVPWKTAFNSVVCQLCRTSIIHGIDCRVRFYRAQ